MIFFLSVSLQVLFLASLIGCSSALSSSGYLSSLSTGGQQVVTKGYASQTPQPLPPPAATTSLSFSHAPIFYFALDNLAPKGPRKNADVGHPHDSSRQLVEVGSISSGSWWCAAGGWPSPAQRDTTEVFFVLSGRGCLTDLDGSRHEFGPGDTVILPKGWSGRWDIMEAIHKVWFVHEHPNIEVTSYPIRVVVTPYSSLAEPYDCPIGKRTFVTTGAPTTASSKIYNVGPTAVGWWTCAPGSFLINGMAATESFHVLEGVFFLTNAEDGTARRCVAGDTVVLPKGWKGHFDVIETVKKLWVVVD